MQILIVTIVLTVVAYGIFVVFFSRQGLKSEERTQKMLDSIAQSQQPLSDAGSESNSILRDEFREESELTKTLYALPFFSSLHPLLVQAGQQQNSDKIFFLVIALAVVSTVGLLQSGAGTMAFLFGPALALILVIKYFSIKVSKRNTKFLNAFPDVLDMFARSVRSGFPVTEAFRLVAESMDAPVGTEFQQVVSEMASGRPTTECLERLARRVNEPDVYFFVAIMKIQQQTGGSMAETVDNLSRVIRKRRQLQMKIKALTSEGRATGYILAALPVTVFLALYFINRDYIRPLWTETGGMIALGVSISLVVGCLVVVREMISIDYK